MVILTVEKKLPSGHAAKTVVFGYATGVWVYVGQDCKTCPFQKDCVKAKSGKRKITRTESDPTREAMRTKVQSDNGKAIYKQRQRLIKSGLKMELESLNLIHRTDS